MDPDDGRDRQESQGKTARSQESGGKELAMDATGEVGAAAATAPGANPAEREEMP